MKTIKIKGDEYKLKYSIKAIFIFEQITDRMFSIETLMDNYILLYSFLLASNPDKEISWDDFVDELDNNPSIIKDFSEFLIHEQEKYNVLLTDDSEKKLNTENK